MNDRHMAAWTHFSLFLVKNDDHIGQIESLLVRIANPKGNSQTPKGNDSKILLKKLEGLIKEKHEHELEELLPGKKKSKRKIEPHPKTMEGMVSKRTPLYRTYKGKEYKATLTPDGFILFNGEKYASPTAPAMVIASGKKMNGWRFWYIKNDAGEWVKLRYYNVK